MELNLTNPGENCNPAMPASQSDRRAFVWLNDRNAKGKKYRFSETISISPSLATAMLACQKINRPLSLPRVQKYARIIQEGGWKVTSEGLAFDRNSHLQNGQHRLNAIIKSGTSATMLIWFGTEPDEFNFIDQGLARTASDLIALSNVDYPNIRAAVTRLIIIMESSSQEDYKHKTGNTVYVKEKTLMLSGDDMSLAIKRSYQSSKVLTVSAGAFAYYWISQNTSRLDLLPTFWERLSTGVGISDSDPIKKIRDPMIKGEITRITGQQAAVKKTAAIIFAWNATVSKRRKFNFTWAHTDSLPEVL